MQLCIFTSQRSLNQFDDMLLWWIFWAFRFVFKFDSVYVCYPSIHSSVRPTVRLPVSSLPACAGGGRSDSALLRPCLELTSQDEGGTHAHSQSHDFSTTELLFRLAGAAVVDTTPCLVPCLTHTHTHTDWLMTQPANILQLWHPDLLNIQPINKRNVKSPPDLRRFTKADIFMEIWSQLYNRNIRLGEYKKAKNKSNLEHNNFAARKSHFN